MWIDSRRNYVQVRVCRILSKFCECSLPNFSLDTIDRLLMQLWRCTFITPPTVIVTNIRTPWFFRFFAKTKGKFLFYKNFILYFLVPFVQLHFQWKFQNDSFVNKKVMFEKRHFGSIRTHYINFPENFGKSLIMSLFFHLFWKFRRDKVVNAAEPKKQLNNISKFTRAKKLKTGANYFCTTCLIHWSDLAQKT